VASTHPQPALLEISNLDVSVNNKPILNNIHLSLAKGEVLGIIGESGSGKSMLALSMMRLLPFDGQDLMQLEEPQLCKLRGSDISMVFQEPMTALNPVLSIGQQVAECVQLHRDVSKREALNLAEACPVGSASVWLLRWL